MEPIVDEAQDKYKGKIEFKLIDLTKGENDELATKYKVYLTPTFIITDEEGEEVDRLIGEVEKKTFETFIDKNLTRQEGGEKE